MGSMIPYPDPVAGAFGTFAVLAALRYRNRTGKGQYIDLSQGAGHIAYCYKPVKHSVLFDVTITTDPYWRSITSEHNTRPDTGIFSNFYISN